MERNLRFSYENRKFKPIFEPIPGYQHTVILLKRFISSLPSLRLNILVNILSTEKLEIELDVDLMGKLKTKADATNKTPSEVVAELLREQLK